MEQVLETLWYLFNTWRQCMIEETTAYESAQIGSGARPKFILPVAIFRQLEVLLNQLTDNL